LTGNHWEEEILLGGGFGGQKINLQDIFPETFYLYRALVAGRTKP
jgi:hypothetical protein